MHVRIPPNAACHPGFLTFVDHGGVTERSSLKPTVLPSQPEVLTTMPVDPKSKGLLRYFPTHLLRSGAFLLTASGLWVQRETLRTILRTQLNWAKHCGVLFWNGRGSAPRHWLRDLAWVLLNGTTPTSRKHSFPTTVIGVTKDMP